MSPLYKQDISGRDPLTCQRSHSERTSQGSHMGCQPHSPTLSPHSSQPRAAHSCNPSNRSEIGLEFRILLIVDPFICPLICGKW